MGRKELLSSNYCSLNLLSLFRPVTVHILSPQKPCLENKFVLVMNKINNIYRLRTYNYIISILWLEILFVFTSKYM